MLVKSRPVPPVIPPSIDRNATTGRLLVQDIYQGLTGVKRGEVKWLRVIEETSRVSPSPMGGSPYNQTFLVSAALAHGRRQGSQPAQAGFRKADRADLFIAAAGVRSARAI